MPRGQNSLNARESSCRCRFSLPFLPLSSPSFPVFLPSRCLLSSPPSSTLPATRSRYSPPPHFRASRIHTPHFRRHCPVHAFRIIPRQRRQSGGEINTRPAGNEPPPAGRRRRPTFQLSIDVLLFFPISLSLSLFSNLRRKILSRVIYGVVLVARFLHSSWLPTNFFYLC